MKIGIIIVLIVIKMCLTLLRKIQVLYFKVLKEILMRTIFFNVKMSVKFSLEYRVRCKKIKADRGV